MVITLINSIIIPNVLRTGLFLVSIISLVIDIVILHSYVILCNLRQNKTMLSW